MNIYLISQEHNNRYDTYDSAIVVASSKEEAIRIHPSKARRGFTEDPWLDAHNNTWVDLRDVDEYISVKFVGSTSIYSSGTVLCASFNAG